MCYSALTLLECFLSGPLVENFVPEFVGEAPFGPDICVCNSYVILTLFLMCTVISMRFFRIKSLPVVVWMQGVKLKYRAKVCTNDV
jgi:hypothetical protein